MRFISIAETEQQKELSIEQNQALFNLIRKKNTKKKLENMQMVRFDDDLVIAIHRPPHMDVPSGSVGTVYTAYPIKINGLIGKTELMVKIVKNTESNIDEDNVKDYERTQTEAHNTNHALSSRMTIIPRPQKENGKTVYETAIVMSKAPGTRADILIEQGKFKKENITPVKRIYLAINLIDFLIGLHEKGIIFGDIKNENFSFDLKSLRGTAFDIDPSYYTPLTKAPEDDITKESDSCSFAQDILTPIFSGKRPLKEPYERFEIKQEIMENFSRGDYLMFDRLSSEICGLLEDMQKADPHERLTLQNAKARLEKLLKYSFKTDRKKLDNALLAETKRYEKQLFALENILSDPQYKISAVYQIGANVAPGDSSEQTISKKYGFFPETSFSMESETSSEFSLKY
jgi:hypothetical protein